MRGAIKGAIAGLCALGLVPPAGAQEKTLKLPEVAQATPVLTTAPTGDQAPVPGQMPSLPQAPAKPGPAPPVPLTSADAQREYDAAFQEMMKQPANLDCPVQVRGTRQPDRRSRRRDLRARADAVDRSQPATRAARVGRPLFPASVLRGRADLSRRRAQFPQPAARGATARAGLHGADREPAEALALLRRGLSRLALPVERQSRPPRPRTCCCSASPRRSTRPPSAPPTGARWRRCRSATPTISDARTNRRSRRYSPPTPTASSSSSRRTSACSTSTAGRASRSSAASSRTSR